jgi:hypothetical protein
LSPKLLQIAITHPGDFRERVPQAIIINNTNFYLKPSSIWAIYVYGCANTQLFNSSLNMKIKKNAAKAVSTPNVKTSAEISAPIAPAPAFSPAKAAAAAAPTTGKLQSSVTGAAGETLTVIDVKHDVGFGNTLFVRGQGGGLTWERGVPLDCVDGKTWRWAAKVKAPLTFKLLINDQIWASGGDITVKPGQKLEVKPTFS